MGRKVKWRHSADGAAKENQMKRTCKFSLGLSVVVLRFSWRLTCRASRSPRCDWPLTTGPTRFGDCGASPAVLLAPRGFGAWRGADGLRNSGGYVPGRAEGAAARPLELGQGNEPVRGGCPISGEAARLPRTLLLASTHLEQPRSSRPLVGRGPLRDRAPCQPGLFELADV